MVTVETVSIVFTGLSISLAAFYYIMTLRNANKARQAQMFNALNQDMTNFDGWLINRDLMYMEWDDYEDFERKYGSDNNPEAYAKRISSWNWQNSLGITLNEGLIDAEMVYDAFGSTMIMSWKKWEPIIREQRTRYMGENWMQYWEYLIDRMIAIQQSRGISWKVPETLLRYVPDHGA